MQRRDFITLVGAAAAWPFVAHAQQLNPTRRMGYLSFSEDRFLRKVFVDRLNELGWVEGENLSITYRSAEGNENALKSMAAELVQTNPNQRTDLGDVPQGKLVPRVSPPQLSGEPGPGWRSGRYCPNRPTAYPRRKIQSEEPTSTERGAPVA